MLRPHSLAVPFMQPGDYFKPRHHFAFKPWEEHKPFEVLVQLMGSIQPSVNIDSWNSGEHVWWQEKDDTNISPFCPLFLLNSLGVKSC